MKNLTNKDIVSTVKKDHQFKTSVTTVQGYLNSIESFKRPKEVSVLSNVNRLKRYYYCMNMLPKSFKNIIFFDESKIKIRRNTRQMFYFKGQEKLKKYMLQKLSIMVFGCISHRGKVLFKILTKMLTALIT